MTNDEKAFAYANRKTNEKYNLNETVEEMLKNTHSEEVNYYIVLNIRAYRDGMESVKEEFQNDEVELMGRKCSEWVSILKEYEEMQKDIKTIVNAFNNYECAGPEQEQESTWEILRDVMHEALEKYCK